MRFRSALAGGLTPGATLLAVAAVLCAVLAPVSPADAYDRVAAIGESPFSAEADLHGPPHGMLIDLVHAMDRVTHSSTKIVLYPFRRSLKETAAGQADFHLPLIEDEAVPPPPGLAYVREVDFGYTSFVIYSRKSAPLDATTIAEAKDIEVEQGHEAFFPFPTHETHCVVCSLKMVQAGHSDALIVPQDVVDPLLTDPQYKDIHRALFRSYPVRALVPTGKDSTATRRYLIDAVTRLKQNGELDLITGHYRPYLDWQP